MLYIVATQADVTTRVSERSFVLYASNLIESSMKWGLKCKDLNQPCPQGGYGSGVIYFDIQPCSSELVSPLSPLQYDTI